MTTYAPRTLLRIFNDDKTAHITGVILKDGSLFGITDKKTYESVDVWKAGSTMKGEMTVDVSKAAGYVLPLDSNGFEVLESVPHSFWIYNKIVQYTPHLLECEDVKTAFNTYNGVLCDKILCYNICVYPPSNYQAKYANLISPDEYMTRGMPFGYVRSTYPNGKTRCQFTKKLDIEHLTSVYTPLYDLIKTDLIPHITKCKEDYVKKMTVSRNKRLLIVYRRRIEKYKKLIELYEKNILEITTTTE
jgi:hypothetical protein